MTEVFQKQSIDLNECFTTISLKSQNLTLLTSSFLTMYESNYTLPAHLAQTIQGWILSLPQ